MTSSAPERDAATIASRGAKLTPYFKDIPFAIKERGTMMQTVMNGYRGLSLLIGLNWDRLFFLGTILVGLLAGAFLGTTLSQP